MTKVMNGLKCFIAADWRAHKVRVCAEVTGMMLSLLVAMVIAFTTPNPPLLLCYILWEIASMLLVSAAVSRRSLGLTVLYAGFLVIDCIGLIRTVLA
jgi:hypothetical protein